MGKINAPPNTLYYGDNLDVLRRYIDDESVDLIYLDPPFNSNADYNVLFAEHDSTKAAAQIQAFEDTWKWDSEAARSFHDAITSGAGKVPQAMQAFQTFLGESDMLAYLSMMAPRLIELHRVLKPTGSIYLHCDPTASHYLKMLMDAVFGPQNFKTEIIWKRSSAHNDTKQGRKQHGRIHDVLLFYAKSNDWLWNPVYTAYSEDYLESEYRHKTADGRYYKESDVTARKPGGDTLYAWRVKRRAGQGERWQADLTGEHESPKDGWEYKSTKPYEGRFWAYSHSNLAAFWKSGHLIHRETGMPRLMQFADDMPGVSLQDLWADIGPELGSKSLGYPTQKPEALLERIISASSNEGDVVLDPFCGCGTAIAVAEKLHRRWVGIDVTHLAVNLIKTRLRDAFNIAPGNGPNDYEVVGEPASLSGAQQLAEDDPFQFQAWALGLVGARVASSANKGADKGIDGKLYFDDNPNPNQLEVKQVIFSVKGGKTSVAHVRDLRGVLDREARSGAVIGVLITLNEASKPMREECASAGIYESPWGTSHARLQIITIAELLDGRTVGMPRSTDVRAATFKKAPRQSRKHKKDAELFDAQGDDVSGDHIDTPL